MPISEQHDFPLDHIHRWKDWYTLAGLSGPTAWRLVKAGRGPITTRLTARTHRRTPPTPYRMARCS